MPRPETIVCKGWYDADGVHHPCGNVVKVKPRGAVPKYCDECRPKPGIDRLKRHQDEIEEERRERRKESLERVHARDDYPGPDPAEQGLAEGRSPRYRSEAEPVDEVPELVERGVVGADEQPICAAPGCSIPDPAHAGKFCTAHWKLIDVGLRGTLLGSEPGSSPHNSALHRAISSLRR